MRYALEALVQYRRPHPPHELDALADTLVAIGVDYGRRPGMESKRVKDEVVGILSAAMRWSTPPYPNGEAYRRVGDRFMALARGLLPDEELTELVAVGGILDRVTGLLEQDDLADIDRDEWLGHLRDFAMSRNWQAAHTAVQILGNERLAPAGSEILRELHYGDLVREPYAREILEGIALRRGWRR